MKIEISFTDDELLRIINSVGPDAEVIFAEGYELPAAYPPYLSQEETFVFECQSAGSQVWGPRTFYQQGETSLFDLAILTPAPSAVWGTNPKVSTEGCWGLEPDRSRSRDLHNVAA